MIVDNGITRLLPQQYFHWLVVNIPGTDLSEGNEVMDYITPFIAERDDNPHPMLLLVYQQRERVGDIQKLWNMKVHKTSQHLQSSPERSLEREKDTLVEWH